jgi:dTDP-glucose 4,6-dehydratase
MALLQKLGTESVDVTVLDSLTYSGKKENLCEVWNLPNFHFIEGDICDSHLVARLIANTDIVINFAAETHVDRSIDSAMPFIQTNVVGATVILNAVRSSPLVRLIQISTDEVYGTIDEGSWDEEFPLRPNSPYAASKAAADLLCLAFSKTYGLDIRITRCSNNYGPNQFPEKIIPYFISRLLKGRTVPIYGNGENIREWIYVEDHCRAIWLVLRNGKSGEVYNIGSNLELSNLYLTEQILLALNKSRDQIDFVEDRLGHDKRYSLNSSKIARELGFQVQTDFDDSLLKTIHWYQEHPEWLAKLD